MEGDPKHLRKMQLFFGTMSADVGLGLLLLNLVEHCSFNKLEITGLI